MLWGTIKKGSRAPSSSSYQNVQVEAESVQSLRHDDVVVQDLLQTVGPRVHPAEVAPNLVGEKSGARPLGHASPATEDEAAAEAPC